MSRVLELFGHTASEGPDWGSVVRQQLCPYIRAACIKTRKSQPEVAIGTCCVSYGREQRRLVICPNRLLRGAQVILDCARYLRFHEPSNDLHLVPEVSVPGGSVDYFLVSVAKGAVQDLSGSSCKRLTRQERFGRPDSAS